MKAIVLTANGSLEVQERSLPSWKDDEYLVKIISCGICNSDIFRAFAGDAYFYPLVMGHEFAGVIIEGGARATKFSPGQAAVVFPLIPCRKCEACQKNRWALCRHYDYFGSRRDGGFQEYLAVPEWNLIPIPTGVDPIFACLCEPLAVSLHSLNLAPTLPAGSTAAVIGAGFIGLTTAMLFQAQGYDTLVFDRNPFKLRLAEKIGLKGMPIEGVGGFNKKFSLVLEATGAVSMFRQSLTLAQPSGSVLWVGNIHGDFLLQKEEVSYILRNELQIKGIWNSRYQQGESDDWAAALQLLATSSWIRDTVTQMISLDDLPRILKELYAIKTIHYPHQILKVLVKMGESA